MKSGISLVEMAKEIQRQAELKADYMMDTRSLRLEPFGSDLYLNAYTPSGEMAVEPLEINAIAHRQIGTHLKIPAAYYDKMLTQHPQLLSENVNAWFEREPAVRLVRTIGGTARHSLATATGVSSIWILPASFFLSCRIWKGCTLKAASSPKAVCISRW